MRAHRDDRGAPEAETRISRRGGLVPLFILGSVRRNYEKRLVFIIATLSVAATLLEHRFLCSVCSVVNHMINVCTYLHETDIS